MTESKISPDEHVFILRLVAEARANGITEIKYKELHLKISLQAQQTGSGPVAMNNTHAQRQLQSWNNQIIAPE